MVSVVASESLLACANQVYLNNTHRVVSFIWKDRLYFLKKAKQDKHAHLRAKLSAVLCSFFFHRDYSAQSLQQGNIHDESDRIRELHHCGYLVPTVCVETERYIVLEDAGTPLEHILNTLTEQEACAWYDRAIIELARLHQHKQWHGGAQLRNLAVKNNHIYRIDFEERFGYVLPEDAVAAYDLFLLLGDILQRLRPDTYNSIGQHLITLYLHTSQRHDVIARLGKLKWLHRLLLLIARVMGKKFQQSLDAKRTLRFFDVLRTYHQKQ